MPELKKDPETGIYQVGIKTPHGKKWKSTGMRNKQAAEMMVESSGLVEIEMASEAGTLTAEAVSMIVAGKKITCKRALELYIENQGMRLKNSSLLGAESTMSHFYTFHQCHEWAIGKATPKMVNDFINRPGDAKYTTRMLDHSRLKSFFRFLQDAMFNLGNPAALVKVNTQNLTWVQLEKKVLVPFTKEEVDMIMKRPLRDGSKFIRWATAISYWTGMRYGDVCCLEWAAISETGIIVHTRKRDKRVCLPFSDPLIGGGELMDTILEMYAERKHDVHCFPMERMEYLQNEGCRTKQLFIAHARRCGIRMKSFHCLRHSFVTRLAAAGRTLEEIGVLVGHSDTETTAMYSH